MSKIMKKLGMVFLIAVFLLVSGNLFYRMLPQNDYDEIAMKSISRDGYGEPLFYHLASMRAVWLENEGIVPIGKQDLLAIYEDENQWVVDYFTAKVSEFNGNIKLRDHIHCRRWCFEKKSGKILEQNGGYTSEIETVLKGSAVAEQRVLWLYIADLELRPFSFGLVSADDYEKLQDQCEILFSKETDENTFGDGTRFVMYCQPGKA